MTVNNWNIFFVALFQFTVEPHSTVPPAAGQESLKDKADFNYPSTPRWHRETVASSGAR